MEPEDLTLESKCENLLNIVVESRKRFGKLCVEYDQKILFTENKILNLQIETICNYRFKPKNAILSTDEDTNKDFDDFFGEISDKQCRVENILKKLRNTHEVVKQLETDVIGRKLRVPLTADTMLAQAKAKQ